MLDDPFAIDRRLRETARAWLAYRRALRDEAALGDGSAVEHRFHDMTACASAELVKALRARAELDPLAPNQARWAFRLYLEHGVRELALGRERAWRGERHALDAPSSGKFSLREMLGGALAGPVGSRRVWFSEMARHAGRARELELRRWERRAELAVELGVSLDAEELPNEKLLEHARTFLNETREPFAALDVRDLTGLVDIALGRGATATWPARLGLRSLASLFEEGGWFRHVELELRELPAALGGASFLRGLVAVGATLRSALAAASLPFAAAYDPYDRSGATLGCLFALVPFGTSFAQRRLDVSRSRLADHRRELARVLLVGSRMLALRVLLRAPTLFGSTALSRAYAEFVSEALGLEIPSELAGVVLRSRVSDPQRFAALLVAAERDARLVEAHDEDWYRNPRAIEELREQARRACSVEEPEALLAAGSRTLGQQLLHAI